MSSMIIVAHRIRVEVISRLKSTYDQCMHVDRLPSNGERNLREILAQDAKYRWPMIEPQWTDEDVPDKRRHLAELVGKMKLNFGLDTLFTT